MITSGAKPPPAQRLRSLLYTSGIAAILASICHPSSFFIGTIGLSDSKILYLITLAEWARPFLIVIAITLLFISFLRIWHPSSAYKAGSNVTNKAFFLFVALLILIVLILPYFAPCVG